MLRRCSWEFEDGTVCNGIFDDEIDGPCIVDPFADDENLADVEWLLQ